MATQSKISKTLEEIKEILQNYPEGALIDDIEAGMPSCPPRRTLQRRLLSLQKAGELSVAGKTQGMRYFLSLGKLTEPPIHPEPAIPLSNQAKFILRQVGRSLQQRIPVGYRRAFLDGYQPNVSAYLSVTEKEKLAQIGGVPLSNQVAGTYAKTILNRLLIDLSWNSSRLEGNTYSFLDTRRLLSFGEQAENKSAAETQMILNHKEAIEFLVESAAELHFNRFTLLNLHAFLSNNLLPDRSASGRLRTFPVGIHQSVYEPPSIPQLIAELFDLILQKAEAILDPFEQAFFAMVHLPYLQPFDDVNKRVSRLSVNIPLIRQNLVPLSFVDVPNDLYIQGTLGVYELNQIELLKDVFLWAYERSAARYSAVRQSLGEPDLFHLQYREAIRTLISQIVMEPLSLRKASQHIKKMAESLPQKDRVKFIETVETELLALHEGNFARYRISPSQFKTWQALINSTQA